MTGCIWAVLFICQPKHRFLDVTGTSNGKNRGALHDDTTQSNYGIYSDVQCLANVSNFSLILAAYCK